MFGYSGKILHIDLTNRKQWVEEKNGGLVKNLYWRRFDGHPAVLGEHQARLRCPFP